MSRPEGSDRINQMLGPLGDPQVRDAFAQMSNLAAEVFKRQYIGQSLVGTPEEAPRISPTEVGQVVRSAGALKLVLSADKYTYNGPQDPLSDFETVRKFALVNQQGQEIMSAKLDKLKQGGDTQEDELWISIEKLPTVDPDTQTPLQVTIDVSYDIEGEFYFGLYFEPVEQDDNLSRLIKNRPQAPEDLRKDELPIIANMFNVLLSALVRDQFQSHTQP